MSVVDGAKGGLIIGKKKYFTGYNPNTMSVSKG